MSLVFFVLMCRMMRVLIPASMKLADMVLFRSLAECMARCRLVLNQRSLHKLLLLLVVPLLWRLELDGILAELLVSLFHTSNIVSTVLLLQILVNK